VKLVHNIAKLIKVYNKVNKFDILILKVRYFYNALLIYEIKL